MAEPSFASLPSPALRRPKLAGGVQRHGSVTVAVLPPASRMSLRAPETSVDALSRAIGIPLPRRPKTSAAAEERIVLWLGPDEWLVIDGSHGGLPTDLESVALCSAVDISHRNVAFAVSGPGCEAVLNAGCPQDLSPEAFPIGAASRTVLGKVEIVLYRKSHAEFRVECWRSFADYVFTFLSDAARNVAAEARG